MNLYTFKSYNDYRIEIIQVKALDIDSAYRFLADEMSIPESFVRSTFKEPVTVFELSNPHGIYDMEVHTILDVML